MNRFLPHSPAPGRSDGNPPTVAQITQPDVSQGHQRAGHELQHRPTSAAVKLVFAGPTQQIERWRLDTFHCPLGSTQPPEVTPKLPEGLMRRDPPPSRQVPSSMNRLSQMHGDTQPASSSGTQPPGQEESRHPLPAPSLNDGSGTCASGSSCQVSPQTAKTGSECQRFPTAVRRGTQLEQILLTVQIQYLEGINPEIRDCLISLPSL